MGVISFSCFVFILPRSGRIGRVYVSLSIHFFPFSFISYICIVYPNEAENTNTRPGKYSFSFDLLQLYHRTLASTLFLVVNHAFRFSRLYTTCVGTCFFVDPYMFFFFFFFLPNLSVFTVTWMLLLCVFSLSPLLSYACFNVL